MAGFGTEALGNAIFGTSTKAKLMFYPYSQGRVVGEPEVWNVMINPSSIYESYGIGYKVEENLEGKEEKQKPIRDSGSHTMSMDLIFDLVDTYELAYNKFSTTGAINGFMSLKKNPNRERIDGKLPKQFAGYNWGNKVSEIYVQNKELTCLTKLKESVSGETSNTLVQFYWGQFDISGFVNDLSVRYTYFSPEGQALRAEVSLRITGVPDSQVETIMVGHKYKKPKDKTNSTDPDMSNAVFDDLFGYTG